MGYYYNKQGVGGGGGGGGTPSYISSPQQLFNYDSLLKIL